MSRKQRLSDSRRRRRRQETPDPFEDDPYFYPHSNTATYNPNHDSAYEWRDDEFLEPTGIFPSRNGRHIEHYEPFDTLDFGPRGDGEYLSQNTHYMLDSCCRHHDNDYAGERENWMAGPDREPEDRLRWSTRAYHSSNHSFTDQNPYDAWPPRGWGQWTVPDGGQFGFLDQEGAGGLHKLGLGYYLDREDYKGRDTLYPKREWWSWNEEMRGDRKLRDKEVDYWPEY
ncbi:hypothetical protein LTR62_006236 [Meristemomyces frigidus]|uniref:Uncharacterized protein n=1 Tax=Meristemomyces frigidus TaxID=1508187 RepID=A0AAN7YEP4_9PEZI|nr:hypothetical protein LTR62_006236 [Meristemomyces frigidus]